MTYPENIGEIEAIDALIKDDASGAFKRHYLDGMAVFRQTLRRKADQGLSAEEFAVADKVIKAFELSEVVFTGSWEKARSA